jgi:predicted DNA-binding transcriptional regulator AlpA
MSTKVPTKPRPQLLPVAPAEPPGELLTPEQAAKLLHLSPRTLEGFRRRGDGPKFSKLGDGRSARILYPRAEIDAWIASRLRASTTEG